MRLRLQANPHVLNRTRDNSVGEAAKRAREVELSVTEIGRRLSGSQISSFEPAAGVVEAAELDGDAGTDAQKRCQGAFVEG